MFLRIFGFFISAIVSLVIYYEVSNVNFSSDEPNKDKLLVDLVSYVLDKLHYDPKIINDDFSIKVYEDFIDGFKSLTEILSATVLVSPAFTKTLLYDTNSFTGLVTEL